MNWKQVPGHEDYEVSNDGQVRRWRNQKRNYMVGKVLKPKLSRHGYLVVSLFSGGSYYHVGIHRLVCMAFHGLPASPELQACHSDGNRLNNVPSNLRWGTAKENADDRSKHGNWDFEHGSGHHAAKLDESAVSEMRKLAASGMQIVKIARLYGVHKVTAKQAIQGETWKHVEQKPVPAKRRTSSAARIERSMGAARQAEGEPLESELSRPA